MLTGQISDLDRSVVLNNLIGELKRTHISRYPLRVVSVNKYVVDIIDERWSAAYVLRINNGDAHNVVKLSSPFIENEKYRSNNSEYNTRKTTDLKKVRRWLKEYTQPLTTEMITKESFGHSRELFYKWRGEFEATMRSVRHTVDLDDFITDAVNYFRTGLPYQDTKLAAFKNPEFLSSLEQHRIRIKSKQPIRHFLLNSDETVSITEMKESYYPPENKFTGHINLVSEDDRAKVAMLKIMEPNTFMPDVGVRLDNYNFWIY